MRDSRNLARILSCFSVRTSAALIIDVGPPDRAVAVLGAGGGPLRAAVAEDGPADARVAVLDFRIKVLKARSVLE